MAIACFAWLAPTAALARPDGIGHTACTGCHITGASTGTTVSISFSSPRIVNQDVTITVTVNPANAGTHPNAGFNLQMSSGGFQGMPSGGAELAGGLPNEATHSTPSGSRTWTLTWRPDTAGTVNWSVYGNAVNGADGSANDAPMGTPRTGSFTVFLPNGDPCSSDGQCNSGECTDGVCCNNACSATCRACTPSAGGQGPAGTCSLLVAGSGECCSSGFFWDGASCVEVNECSGANDCCISGSGGCQASATCNNTSGSYTCDCAIGFSGDGFTSGTSCIACPAGTTTFGSDQFCSNINECLTASCGNGTCVEIPLASWAAPGFTCTCDPGYEQADLPGGRTCIDIDECTRGTDDCTDPPAGICTNSVGSFGCSCNSPAFVGTTGRDCVDYDECMDTVYTSTCSSVAHCENGFGTWDCVCNDGFEGDGMTCTDIPECERDLDDCDVNATCIELVGSFDCMCNVNWEGSGVTCTDVNECVDGTSGCGQGEVCVNQIGAPNTCVCAQGLTRPAPDQPCQVRCGDATRGPGEGCDDGNATVGDGCSDACEVEPGWACVETPADGPSTCMFTCGDGLIDAFEECDDGPANSDTAPDACRTDCVRAFCGDSVLDMGEECDVGDDNDDAVRDACRTTCDRAYCGDGVLDTGEICDNGGGLPGASIAGACTTMCNPDGGIDPMDPPSLTGGGGCSATQSPSSSWWLLPLAAILFVIRRRSKRA